MRTEISLLSLTWASPARLHQLPHARVYRPRHGTLSLILRYTDVAEICNWLMFTDLLLHVAITYSRDHVIRHNSLGGNSSSDDDSYNNISHVFTASREQQCRVNVAQLAITPLPLPAPRPLVSAVAQAAFLMDNSLGVPSLQRRSPFTTAALAPPASHEHRARLGQMRPHGGRPAADVACHVYQHGQPARVVHQGVTAVSLFTSIDLQRDFRMYITIAHAVVGFTKPHITALRNNMGAVFIDCCCCCCW